MSQHWQTPSTISHMRMRKNLTLSVLPTHPNYLCSAGWLACYLSRPRPGQRPPLLPAGSPLGPSGVTEKALGARDQGIGFYLN